MMAHYARPQYEAAEVNKAARTLVANERDGVPYDSDALVIVNNWRGAHDYPLNSIHMTMKNRAKRILGDQQQVLSAQRIKRLDSIMLKLHDREQMKLTQMQDIGGCRVILPTIKQVYELCNMYRESPVVHEMLAPKDYINEPVPDTGYRSVHLKFRFQGRGASSPWNGLKVEMQIRTATQHRWATAVEAAGTLRGQMFKSRRGDQEWRRFFHLASAAYAYREKTVLVPNAPENLRDVIDELRAIDAEHQIVATMGGYSRLIREIDKKRNAYYYVLLLDPINSKINVWEYNKDETVQSAEHLERLEQEVTRPAQVVRVSVSSLSHLKRAYPNYFLDTGHFLRDVQSMIRSSLRVRAARQDE
ncbi:RelA/SpoT domain-containing protein [Burkholderia multivorans]|uniref:RelA/SpoT domain-containing protein n=1 Tax=Burkholderia multivorans TaxID=87883 RepID=UPI000B5A5B6A|nr:RelA/SpoT domain-containing protein [Burkholderia multivorans]